MSDQDNLRDRISTVMWSATISDGRRAAMVPDCKAMAQAIIDDLHLESYPFTRHAGHTTTHVHGWMEPQP